MSERDEGDSKYKGEGEFKDHAVDEKGSRHDYRFEETHTDEVKDHDVIGGKAEHQTYNLETRQQRHWEKLAARNAWSLQRMGGKALEHMENKLERAVVQEKAWAELEKQFSKGSEKYGPKMKDASKGSGKTELKFLM
jgi:hypothetical protein